MELSGSNKTKKKGKVKQYSLEVFKKAYALKMH